MVSLFPADTFKGRVNGMRRDLAEMIAAMKPAFMRFPGGCYVEGDEIGNRFQWKKTLGDIAERPGHWSLWGYRSTDGLDLPGMDLAMVPGHIEENRWYDLRIDVRRASVACYVDGA